VVARFDGWAKQADERTSLLRRLNIGPRLTICFVLIILAMLVASTVLLWQFQRVRSQAERLSGVDQELIIVLQAHTSLMSFYERLDALAQSENTAEFVREAESLHAAVVEDSRRIRNALNQLPEEVHLDPTLVSTLEAIQDTLPAELADITDLAKSNDWQAVRLRITKQVRPLESRTSELVANIDRDVSEKRAQALLNIGQAQRRILLIVPITTVLTLLFAGFLGLVITHSITQPLSQLMDGSEALAGGDFSHRVPAAGNDEIALLGNVFNDMIVRLRELYREQQSREAYLAEAQKLSHTGSFGWDVSSGEFYWSPETFRIFEYEPGVKVSIELAVQRTHPEDRLALQQRIERVSSERTEFDFELRLLMPDGSIKYLRVVGRPSKDSRGQFEFVGAVTDITESKRAEEALRRSEAYLAEAQRLSRTGSFGWNPSSGAIYWSQETFRIFECEATAKVEIELIVQRTHPDDRSFVQQLIERVSRDRTAFDFEHRLLVPGGTVKYIRVIGRPSEIEDGGFEFVGAVMDVTGARESRQALEKAYSEIQVLKDELQKENIVLREEVARTSGRLEERERIARDLHDTLLQTFHGVLLRFQAATNLLLPDESKQTFESAIEQGAQAITECRDAVQGLRYSAVVTNDLAQAISAFGQELASGETNPNAAEFCVEVEGTSRDLDPILRDEVYRIAGEAVRNAFKHAQARRIEVQIRYDEQQFHLRVRDDGKGIDPKLLNEDGRPRHFGLRGMRERAELTGGKLVVWSELNSGTEVELRIPASRAYETSPA
jgi:PAS domain S-box-containing protein